MHKTKYTPAEDKYEIKIDRLIKLLDTSFKNIDFEKTLEKIIGTKLTLIKDKNLNQESQSKYFYKLDQIYIICKYKGEQSRLYTAKETDKVLKRNLPIKW